MRTRHPSRAARALAERIAAHPFVLGVVGLLVAAVLAYVSWIVAEGVPFLEKYSLRAVLPADGPVVRTGDEVRIAGLRAGKVTDVEAAGDGRLAHIRLYKRTPVYADARVTVQQRGLAGAVRLDLTRGGRGKPLPSNALIPLRRTDTGQDLASVAAGFGPAARRALGRTVTAYGGGLLGTGEPLNRAITDLGPVTTDGRRLLRALAPDDTALADTFGALGDVARGFAGERQGDLGRFLEAGDPALAALAAGRDQLGSAFDRLAPLERAMAGTLPATDALLVDLRVAAADLRPGVAALRGALPRVNRLLGRRAELDALPALTRGLDPVLERGRPLLDELRPLARVIDPLLTPALPLARHIASYREDIVGGLAKLASTGTHTYPMGLAQNTRAIRFTPIFTCMRGRTPYPAPNASIDERLPQGGKPC